MVVSAYLSLVQESFNCGIDPALLDLPLKIRPGHLTDWFSTNWQRRNLPLEELAVLSIGQISEMIQHEKVNRR